VRPRRLRSPAWALLLLLGAAGGCAPGAPARPNVLLYVIDTLRADELGAYARSAHTPVMDRLASEGLVLEQALAHSSWTRSSMASILTGRLPARHGTEGRDDRLPARHGTEGRDDRLPALATLAELLGAAGYASVFVNANPNAAAFFGFDRGFDRVIELHGRSRPGRVQGDELVARSEEITARALEWLASAPRPFLLVALSVDPHYPYRRSSPAAGTLSAEGLRRMYRQEIAANDASLGELLRGLGPELDDTLVVLTSDHGEEFLEHGSFGHGRSLYEEVLRVPLILRYPRRIPAGRRAAPAATHVDLVPTILEVAGVEPPAELDGASLLGDPEGARPALASLDLDGVRLRSARLGPWKLIESPATGELAIFRLDRDPGERRPLAPGADPAAGEALARLAGALREGGGPGGERPAAALALPAELRETLESLGYAEPGAAPADPRPAETAAGGAGSNRGPHPSNEESSE